MTYLSRFIPDIGLQLVHLELHLLLVSLCAVDALPVDDADDEDDDEEEEDRRHNADDHFRRDRRVERRLGEGKRKCTVELRR